MTRKDIVFGILGAFFLTNAVLAELIGGKLIFVAPADFKIGPIGPFAMSVGVVPWPVVFVATDLINEYFGRRGVRRLTFLTVIMIAYAFLVLAVTLRLPATPFSGIGDAAYNAVFGQSQWIIVGSITAFLLAQLIDVAIFHAVRRRTGKAMLWMRATGSTIISQVLDTVVVLYIGLKLPGDLGLVPPERAWSWGTYLGAAIPNYLVKLGIAVLMTPFIYLGHAAVDRFLGKEQAEAIAEEAARASEGG
jgi:hypothetical protein